MKAVWIAMCLCSSLVFADGDDAKDAVQMAQRATLNETREKSLSPATTKLQHPEKIGIGTWELDKLGTTLEDVEANRFGWYYDWRTTRLWSPSDSVSRHVPFVPMIWGQKNVNEKPPRKSGVLLGFNEPDISTQSNLTPTQAIRLWPKLMATGLRLGSPATTADHSLGETSWLGQFMSQAEALGYRVDFIAVHYYTTSKDPLEFKNFLDQIYNTYHRPIWVTEWGLVDWSRKGRFTAQDNADFAAAALPMLDAHPAVERHAWFSAISDGSGIHTELWDSHHKLTPVGQVFIKSLNSHEAPGSH